MTRSALSASSRIGLAEPTQTAMLHAAGDRGAAALVLGITPRTLSRRLAECTWQGKRGPESLSTWARRMWPERRNGLAQAHGGAFVPVVEVRAEPGLVRSETALYRSRVDGLSSSLAGTARALDLVRRELALTEPLACVVRAAR